MPRKLGTIGVGRASHTSAQDLNRYGGITMKKTVALLAAIAFCVVSSVYANYVVDDKGTWPKSWPEELEPLRKQSRTLQGSLLNLVFYEIPFTKREDFESAWPHILKIKSQGAPLILLRGSDTRIGRISAGVCIQCPPPQTGNRVTPSAPDDTTKARELPVWAPTVIELVVDGDIVDLNRIPLPADTPIVDERFKDGKTK